MDIKLKGAGNIRDFSEYGYKDYIRSAHLSKLTPGDVDILKNSYNLKTVIDLRTSEEAAEKPDAAMSGVKYIHIPIFEGAVPGVSHEKETDKLKSVIPDMPKFYELMVTEERHVLQIKKVMEIINDRSREGAILWHCTEGKDRCGIISALFLLSRGVDKEKVIEDYLLTNRVNKAKARKYFVLITLLGRGKEFAANVRDAFLAKREYLEPIMDKLVKLSDEYTVETNVGKKI